MLKKILSLVLVVLLIGAVGNSSVYAGSKEDKEARIAAKVKKNIIKLGTGTDARIEVKLQDKTKLKGYVSEINEDNFVVVEDKTNIATAVPYQNAKQIKGNNLSNGVIIALYVGAIIAVGLILGVFLAQ